MTRRADRLSLIAAIQRSRRGLGHEPCWRQDWDLEGMIAITGA
jgi:hypothetical protein